VVAVLPVPVRCIRERMLHRNRSCCTANRLRPQNDHVTCVTTKVVTWRSLRAPASTAYQTTTFDMPMNMPWLQSTVQPQQRFVMLVGGSRTGELLEIGTVSDDDLDYIIHAMPARPKYLRLLNARKE
jgi:hypothetical protein